MKWNELDAEKQTIIRRLYAGEVLMADDVGHIPNFATQYSYYHHGWVISDEGKTFVKTGEWTRSLTADDTPEQAELAALREQVATLTRALAWYADSSHYRLRESETEGGVYLMCDIDDDDGERARRALQALEQGGDANGQQAP
jgi:hypothetical protein